MITNQTEIKNQSFEIGLMDVVNFSRKYFLRLFFVFAVFTISGIAISFLRPKRYTAQTILLPEYKIGKTNSFFSMAVGANENGAEKLIPDLYPTILNSSPFGQYLLKTPIVDEANNNYPSLEKYLARSSNGNWLNQFSFSEKQPVVKPVVKPQIVGLSVQALTNEEEQNIKSAKSLIKTTVDTENGIIKIECELVDPVVAAILVEASKTYLTNYVEEYRTSKTELQEDFLEKRVKEVKKRQENAEYALQSYRDRNRNSFLNVARIEEQRLQAEYTLAQSIYSDLAFKLEQSKIKVKEERPVFKVLEPTRVPLVKSSPNRPLFGLITGAIGAFLMLIYIIFFKERLHLKFFQMIK
ncbi:hypothetical protein DSL64_09675 [Dyadobacter luteus]|uniref:Lipopolysaccharide biosynthesis protein n=1 Tax=Dyadobacter luteus TaxID=2259619 RepID=A0A3D8YDA8_9BACT|nr:hypothetical protein [Dyadobacter luteus]REA62507.1 hypothetical protein DSL64_09675 [Dyadobacter luteus]